MVVMGGILRSGMLLVVTLKELSILRQARHQKPTQILEDLAQNHLAALLDTALDKTLLHPQMTFHTGIKIHTKRRTIICVNDENDQEPRVLLAWTRTISADLWL